MKYLHTAAFLITLCVATTGAHAQTSRIYFAGYMGFSAFDDVGFSDSATPATGTFEPDNVPNFAGALGIRFSRNLRMEAELSYRSPEFNTANIVGTGSTPVTGDIKSSLLMLNGYYDFDIRGWKTQPYVTAGVGVGYHTGEITDPGAFTANVDDSAFGFAWNIGTGLKYRVRDNFAWTAGYRYLDGSSLELNSTDVDLSSHEFRIGLEWDLEY